MLSFSPQRIFSDRNGMKLETNSRRKTGKFTAMWILNLKPGASLGASLVVQ